MHPVLQRTIGLNGPQLCLRRSHNMSYSLPAKLCRETDAERMLAGKLFHAGPATAQLHLPSIVLVLGTMRHRLSADRRCRQPATELPGTVVTGTQSSVRYGLYF